MNVRTQWLKTAATAGIAVLALAACGGDAPREAAAPADDGETADVSSDLGLIEPGTLTVGMNLQFEPQMYLDDAGEPAGYDVELLNMLAEDLGVELDIQNLDFNGLIPGLQAERFDMVSVGLSPTPERQEAVDFSRAYVPYVQVLGVPVDTEIESTVEAYNNPDRTIVALQGSTGEALARETFPEAAIQSFPDQNAALLEVATGRADGIVVENYILAQFSEANPGQLEEAGFEEPLNIEYGSYAVQEGNTALVEYLDDWICGLQEDGTLASTYESTIGVDEAPPFPPC
jgi:ABC-type amino acid transport substrate-binding protein